MLPLTRSCPTGGIQFDDTQVSASWLADSDNGATALAMTGSDQVRTLVDKDALVV